MDWVGGRGHRLIGVHKFSDRSNDPAFSRPSISISQVTQVVDGNWGAHVVIPKYAFEKNKESYRPKVACGTSTVINCS